MQDEVIRHIHKYAMPMYVMVSVPEVKEDFTGVLHENTQYHMMFYSI